MSMTREDWPESARGLLLRYGRHDADCAYCHDDMHKPKPVCTCGLDEALAQLRAYGEACRGGWLPIESAPMDGSWFMTYIPDMDGPDCFDFARWDEEWGGFGKLKCGYEFVTHWRPMPAPPAIAGRGGE